MSKSWNKFWAENADFDVYWKDVEWLKETSDRYFIDDLFTVEMIGKIDGTDEYVKGIASYDTHGGKDVLIEVEDIRLI